MSLVPDVPDPIGITDEPTRKAIKRLCMANRVTRNIINSLVRAGEIEQDGLNDYSITHPKQAGSGGSVTFTYGRQSNWHISEGPPPDEIGEIGDFCVDVAFCAFWHKESIALNPPRWVLLAEFGSPGPRGKDGLSIPGPAGAAGPPGPERNVLGAELERTTTQAITTGTDTIVTWPTTVVNDGNFLTGGTPWDQLIAPLAGWYIVTGAIRWEAAGSGYRNCWLMKNGTEIQTPQSGNATTVTDVALEQSKVIKLAATDYMQLRCYHDRGSNLNVTGGYFSMARL